MPAEFKRTVFREEHEAFRRLERKLLEGEVVTHCTPLTQDKEQQ
jgi:hypothetical protein